MGMSAQPAEHHRQNGNGRAHATPGAPPRHDVDVEAQRELVRELRARGYQAELLKSRIPSLKGVRILDSTLHAGRPAVHALYANQPVAQVQ